MHKVRLAQGVNSLGSCRVRLAAQRVNSLGSHRVRLVQGARLPRFAQGDELPKFS